MATRGERLALHRTHFEGTVAGGGGALDVEEVLDLEDEDAAWAELDARYATSEGALYPRATAARMAQVRAYLDRDWDAFAAPHAPDVVCHDHRLLGWGTLHGVDAWVRMQRTLVELAPDTRVRDEHVVVAERGDLVSALTSGTRDGGAFELAFLRVSEIDAAGKLRRIDLYDTSDVDAALARFEELRARERCEPLGAWAKENVATISMERTWAAFDAIDLAAAERAIEAARAYFAPEFVWEDRRPVVGLAGDLDLMLASARERLASGARHERRTIVGTAGDRIAIAGVLWAGGPQDGRFEVELLVVHEVNEAGLCTALLFFEPDDVRAAQREAWTRWAAIDPSVAPWVALLNEITDGWNARDRAALLARFADDVVVVDHRHTGIGRIDGAAAYVDANAVLWDLAPDQRIAFDSSGLRFDRHVLLVTLRRAGTLIDGGAFESAYVWVSCVDGDRITRLELFEIEALDAALARFEALRRGTSAASRRA